MLCREFTELQGGKISFESEVNVGSVFIISMPLCTQSDQEKEVNPPEEMRTSKKVG
ncbi:hypothetical protein D3C87_1989430 [compost metagenome]